uniref:Uncharacterized protein n=1 Tax=Nelumbo nucifera TaxID=4432 RepID=A0A822ZK80_NELNU|nr:TPA_asm: hypothetical protein HUJ06_016432 [Nelumbo nucifera]
MNPPSSTPHHQPNPFQVRTTTTQKTEQK